ncbi:hypothetical protein Agub_g10811, partial [Astrephomene gubernaculifera]
MALAWSSRAIRLLPFAEGLGLVVLVVATEEVLRRVVLLRLRIWRRRTDASAYDGLQGLVSYSACLIAANRAVETEQEEPYILDPLAAGLCGQQALEAARKRIASAAAAAAAAAAAEVTPAAAGAAASDAGTVAQVPAPHGSDPGGTGSPTAPPCTPGGAAEADREPRPVALLQQPRARPIPRLIMRTKFFDDVVLCTTWQGEGPGAAPAGHSCHARLLEACRTAPPCLQVVLLGSGLDARPWRLALPPGLRWLEVDRRDVLAAKQARLRALGAELQRPPPAATPAGTAHHVTPQQPAAAAADDRHPDPDPAIAAGPQQQQP